MTVSYNGIQLAEPLETLAFSKTPVYDKANNYLWTQVRLTVLGTYNPGTTSYGQAGLAAPGAVEGKFAPDTETAIRHKLAQSRGKLLWTVQKGTQFTNVIQSPAPGFTVDAQNGPISQVHDVKEVWGCKTFLVLVSFETFINEASLFVAQPSVMLSNTWSATHTVDRDAYTTRIVRGKAIFRSDRLAQLNAVPDDFRNYLFQPVPAGFQRMEVRVLAAEDGTEADYEVIDEQVPFTVIFPGVTWVEGTHTAGVVTPGLEELGWRAADYALDSLSGIGSALSSAERLDVGGILGAAGTGLKRQLHFIKDNVPKRHEMITVRVWGNSNSRKSDLQAAAIKIMQTRLANLAQILFSGVTFVVTEDIAGKFVDAHVRLEMGPISGAAQLVWDAIRVLRGQSNTLFGFPNNENVPGVLQAGAQGNTIANDSMTRGTYLGRLVASAILGQDAVPPKPTDPGGSKSLQPP